MKSSTNQGTLADYQEGFETYSNKLFTFRLSHINTKPQLTRQVDANGEGVPVYFPPRVTIPTSDIIFDADTKKRREIRYIPGASTIFVDKMTEQEKSDRNNYVIAFINGKKVVEGYDKNLVEYMFKTNWNTENPNKTGEKPLGSFFLIDKEAYFKNKIDTEKALDAAKHWCYNSNSVELIEYALPLFGAGWMENKDVYEVRVAMANLASQSPTTFMANKDKAEVKRKGVVVRAIARGILHNNITQGQISWADNKSYPLSTAPIGVDPIDHFVAATFTPSGEVIFAEVIQRLKPIMNAQMNPAPQPKPAMDVNHISKEEIDKMIAELFEHKIIEKSGTWVKYGDKQKWTSESRLATDMKNDPAVLKAFKEELENVTLG